MAGKIRNFPDKVHHVVEAIRKTAEANHYLVSVDLSRITADDLYGAEQLLIDLENAGQLERPDLCFAIVENYKSQREKMKEDK